jgi:hypothetical protein
MPVYPSALPGSTDAGSLAQVGRCLALRSLDIGKGRKEVRSVEHAGVEAALPQASAAIQAAMHVLRVLTGDVLHETADGAILVARDDQVDVIREERVALDGDQALVGVVIDEGQEAVAVVVGEEQG